MADLPRSTGSPAGKKVAVEGSIDHSVPDMYLNFILKQLKLSKPPVLKGRSSNSAWLKLVEALEIEDDPDECLNLRTYVLEYLDFCLNPDDTEESILDVCPPHEAPLASVIRVLQIWFKHSGVDQTLKEDLVKTITSNYKSGKVIREASLPREEETKVKRPSNKKPVSAKRPEEPNKASRFEDQDFEVDEEEEESDGDELTPLNARVSPEKLHQDSVKMMKSTKSRSYENRPLDKEATVLSELILCDPERWVGVDKERIYNGLRRIYYDVVPDTNRNFYFRKEIKDILDNDIPRCIDHVYRGFSQPKEFTYAVENMDNQIIKLNKKKILALHGLSKMREYEHHVMSYDSRLPAHQKAYHVVLSKQGFRNSPPTGATGNQGKGTH
jgi:hypothetical protein